MHSLVDILSLTEDSGGQVPHATAGTQSCLGVTTLLGRGGTQTPSAKSWV